MRIQRYLVLKGLAPDQDKTIPKHFTELLSVHRRASDIKPTKKAPDAVDTRGLYNG
jgi:hypothetical protein